MPFLTNFFGWGGSPTKIDVLKKVGTLLLSSLLEDLIVVEREAKCKPPHSTFQVAGWCPGPGLLAQVRLSGPRL